MTGDAPNAPIPGDAPMSERDAYLLIIVMLNFGWIIGTVLYHAQAVCR